MKFCKMSEIRNFPVQFYIYIFYNFFLSQLRHILLELHLPSENQTNEEKFKYKALF